VPGAHAVFSITAPGSYRLTRNLMGTAGKSGIEIAASQITLDLSGFSLIGSPRSEHGIIVTAPCRGLRILNGSIRGWGFSGVAADLAISSRFESLDSEGNGLDGLNVGISGVVRTCTAANNGRDGIKTDAGCIVDRCTALRNGRLKEGGQGIDAGDASYVTGCTAYANYGSGIYVGSGATVRHCSVQDNRRIGIEAEPRAVITNCTVSRNRGDGIHTGQAGRVQSCTVSLNSGDGIEVSSASLVISNSCTLNGSPEQDSAPANGGAGVRATGFANRIESNHLAMNRHGLVVSGDGNVILGNSAVLNGTETPSDRDIADGNTLQNEHRLPSGESTSHD